MERLPTSTFLKFNPETLQYVRKTRGLNQPGRIVESITLLEEWIKQQKHFKKKIFDQYYLERVIISSKGYLERAKGRIDKLCTFRTLMPQYFGEFNAREDFNTITSNQIYHSLIPTLTKDHNRIFILKNSGKHFDSNTITNCYKLYCMVSQYVMKYDYCDGYIIILDYTECALVELLTKLSINELRQCFSILIEGYGVRQNSIHIVSSSKTIDVFVGLLKQILSAKLGKRIYSHKNFETVCDYVDKDILPSDYGGQEKSMVELNDIMFDVLSSKKFREYWNSMCQANTDESLRAKDTFNDQYLGMPGTFRTLSVD